MPQVCYNLAVMPIIKSAIKKVRVDKRRTAINLVVKRQMKQSVDLARKKPTQKNLAAAASALAKAAKKKVIHRNKAARLLGRLARRATKK